MNVCRSAIDHSDVAFQTNAPWHTTPGERSHPARKLKRQLKGFQSLPLVTPSKRLMELLAVARLQAVVNVCDTESQALSLALPA